MLLRIFILSVVVAAALVFVQQRQMLENAGLTGYCTEIATPQGQSGHWHECRPGKLTGTPQLSQTSCIRAGRTGEVERWRCPTALGTNRTRQ